MTCNGSWVFAVREARPSLLRSCGLPEPGSEKPAFPPPAGEKQQKPCCWPPDNLRLMWGAPLDTPGNGWVEGPGDEGVSGDPVGGPAGWRWRQLTTGGSRPAAHDDSLYALPRCREPGPDPARQASRRGETGRLASSPRPGWTGWLNIPLRWKASDLCFASRDWVFREVELAAVGACGGWATRPSHPDSCVPSPLPRASAMPALAGLF
jgi:hypothetical protein